jgi:hypothetical protein
LQRELANRGAASRDGPIVAFVPIGLDTSVAAIAPSELGWVEICALNGRVLRFRIVGIIVVIVVIAGAIPWAIAHMIRAGAGQDVGVAHGHGDQVVTRFVAWFVAWLVAWLVVRAGVLRHADPGIEPCGEADQHQQDHHQQPGEAPARPVA